MAQYLIPGNINNTYPHCIPIKGERDHQFEAFQHFLNQGPKRTLTATAVELNVGYTTVCEWVEKFFWRERLANFLDEQRMELYKKKQESLIKIEENILDTTEVALKRIEEIIPTLNFPKGDMEKAAKAVESFMKIMRLLGNESTQNIAIRTQNLSDIPTDKLKKIQQVLSEEDDGRPNPTPVNPGSNGHSSIPTHPPELDP